MENQLAELKNEIECLRDELRIHKTLIGMLYRETLTEQQRKQIRQILNTLSENADLTPEQVTSRTQLMTYLEQFEPLAE